MIINKASLIFLERKVKEPKIGDGYQEIINYLIRRNKPKIINLLYYDAVGSLEIDWQHQAIFVKQLKIWTTSFPYSQEQIVSLGTETFETFLLKNFLFSNSKLLGLHSFLLDKKGEKQCWLMLDFRIKPGPEALRKIKFYVKNMLNLSKIKGGGFLVQTDRSYHFIGRKIIAQEIYKEFLKKIIKSDGGSGLIDIGFCGHALTKDLDICLRIQKKKEGKKLKIVARI